MKKQTLAQDAFKLYAEKFMSLEDIARQLHLNERTLRRWKKSDNWETKRAEYIRTKTTLHSDLYNFTRSLINSIERIWGITVKSSLQGIMLLLEC